MNQETRDLLQPDVIDAAPPCYKLLRDFVRDDSAEMRDRFKV